MNSLRERSSLRKLARPSKPPKTIGNKGCPECGRTISVNKPLCKECKEKYDRREK